MLLRLSSRASNHPSMRLQSKNLKMPAPLSLVKQTWTRWVWALSVCKATTSASPKTLLMTDIQLVEVLLVVRLLLKPTQLFLLSELTQVVQLTIQLIVRVFSHLSLPSAEFQDLVRFFIQVQTKPLARWLTQSLMYISSSVRKHISFHPFRHHPRT